MWLYETVFVSTTKKNLHNLNHNFSKTIGKVLKTLMKGVFTPKFTPGQLSIRPLDPFNRRQIWLYTFSMTLLFFLQIYDKYRNRWSFKIFKLVFKKKKNILWFLISQSDLTEKEIRRWLTVFKSLEFKKAIFFFFNNFCRL